jgi:uncharacterized membrane protein
LIKNDFDRRLLWAIAFCVALSVFFYAMAMFMTEPQDIWYLLPNLLLAGVPLLLTYPLLSAVRKYGWLNLRSAIWGLMWLGFLPNSFYIVSDSIHLLDQPHTLDPLFGMVLFGLFGFAGMSIGFVCLYFVHRMLLEKRGRGLSYAVMEIILLLSSVAIYLGRTLRWNSWDILLHPLSLIRDGIGIVVTPTAASLGMIGMFFLLLSGLYAAICVMWGKPIGFEKST